MKIRREVSFTPEEVRKMTIDAIHAAAVAAIGEPPAGFHAEVDQYEYRDTTVRHEPDAVEAVTTEARPAAETA
jgi:hypothetical protein